MVARTRSGAFDRLVTVGRIALGDREAWVCVRVKVFRMDLLLVESPVVPDWGTARSGRTVRGQIRWLARYPLGVGGDVPLVALEDYQWVPVEHEDGKAEPLANSWKSLDLTKLEDGKQVLNEWGHLQVKRLGPDDAEGCAWQDPSTREAFRSAAREAVWTIAWVDGPLITPLAIVEPPGILTPARVIHLTVGNPSDRIET